MAIGTILLAGAAGVGTYAAAKSKNKTNGEAALAGAAVGAGTALAIPLALTVLGWAVMAAVVAIPVGGAIYLLNKNKDQKALPPGS